MFNTKLSKAITMALAGTALAAGSVSVASAASTTMYNVSLGQDGAGTASTTNPFAGGTYNTSYYGATDGWTNSAKPNTFNRFYLNHQYGLPVGTNTSKWVGINGSSTITPTNPFNYEGSHLNWAAEFTGGNNSATISSADSGARYGIYADIDTAKGAWSDTALGGAVGWRHDLDLGLFKTDTDGQVTLNVTGVLQTGTDFGISVFDAVDHVEQYNHHGEWTSSLSPTDPNFSPFNTTGGGGFMSGHNGVDGSSIVASTDQSVNPTTDTNTLTFNAIAGHTYSIFIGGYRNGAWGDTVDGYQLDISQSTSPVPVPAAAWLFGSAMLSLLGVNRRKLTRKG